MKQDLQNFFLTNNVFSQLGIDRIGVFGSYSRGEKYNDIDLLLDKDPGYKKREMLKNLVETQLHIPCDIVVKSKLEPHHSILHKQGFIICPKPVSRNFLIVLNSILM